MGATIELRVTPPDSVPMHLKVKSLISKAMFYRCKIMHVTVMKIKVKETMWDILNQTFLKMNIKNFFV